MNWPFKGKGKGEVKIWHCVLSSEAGRTEQNDIGPKSARRPREQEDIRPKPARRSHTAAGKEQLHHIVLDY